MEIGNSPRLASRWRSLLGGILYPIYNTCARAPCYAIGGAINYGILSSSVRLR